MSAQVTTPHIRSQSLESPSSRKKSVLAGEAAEENDSFRGITNSVRVPRHIRSRSENNSFRSPSRHIISAFAGHSSKRSSDLTTLPCPRSGKRSSANHNVTKAGPQYRSSVATIPRFDEPREKHYTSRSHSQRPSAPKLTIQVPSLDRAVSHHAFTESSRPKSRTRPTSNTATRSRTGSKSKPYRNLDKSLPASPRSECAFGSDEATAKSQKAKSRMTNESIPPVPLPVYHTLSSASDSQLDRQFNTSPPVKKANNLSKAARLLGVSQEVLENEQLQQLRTFYSDTSDDSDEELQGSLRSIASSQSSFEQRSSMSSPLAPSQRDDSIFRKQAEKDASAADQVSDQDLSFMVKPLQLNDYSGPRPLSPSNPSLSPHESQYRTRETARFAQKPLSAIHEVNCQQESETFHLDQVSPTPPLLPKKSEKRALSRHTRQSDAVMKAVEKALAEIKPMSEVQALHPTQRTAARPLSLAVRKKSEALISAVDAENVIMQILRQCNTFEDLSSVGRINQGFYTIFRRHELELIKQTIHNQSPAAFEFRQTSLIELTKKSGGGERHLSPAEVLRQHSQDGRVIAELRSLIVDNCQSYIRPETLEALKKAEGLRSEQIDAAFWRIWTFCTIFGSGRGREDDVVGQIDWLNGGILAHQSNGWCASGSDEAFVNSQVLLKASETFAAGNFGGLSAEELYDMNEIWNCLSALLNGIIGPGRVDQARQYGVFGPSIAPKGDKSAASKDEEMENEEEEEGGDKDEERLLEEWLYYLCSLGLPTTLRFARLAASEDDTVFKKASAFGWTTWKQPEEDASRSTFFKEAVTRVYQERMASIMADAGFNSEEVEQVKRHKKQQSIEMAAALRELKEKGTGKLVEQSEERPMSIWTPGEGRYSFFASTYSAVAPSPLHVAARSSRAASIGGGNMSAGAGFASSPQELSTSTDHVVKSPNNVDATPRKLSWADDHASPLAWPKSLSVVC